MHKSLFFVVLFSALAIMANAAVTAVTPTDSDKDGFLEIDSPGKLLGFANLVNGGTQTAKAKLTKNIDFNDTWTSIGTSGKPFKGTFDGQGFKISGLKYDNNSNTNYIGLFGSINGATIKNVGVTSSSITGGNYVGGLVGYAQGTTSITNSSFQGTSVTGKNYVGGLVGYVASGTVTIDGCYNMGTVTAKPKEWYEYVGGSYNAGGLVGVISSKVNEVSISNSFNSGSISNGGFSFFGTLENDALTTSTGNKINVDNCYTTGKSTSQYNGNGATSKSSVDEVIEALQETDPNSSWATDESGNVVVKTVVDLSKESGCVTVKDYALTVSFKTAEAQKFYSDGAIFTGSFDRSSVTGTELCPVSGLSASKANGKLIVTVDASADELLLPSNLTKADSVIFNRGFEAGVYSTVMFPFTKPLDKFSGAQFFTFTGVAYNTVLQEWEARFDEVTEGDISANTPYLVLPSSSNITISGEVTFSTSGSRLVKVGNWEFRGVYSFKKWEEGDAELGRAYGFAAKSKTVNGIDINAGDIVKAAAGASIRNSRGYMLYNPSTARPQVSGVDGAPAMKFMPEATESIEAQVIKLAVNSSNNSVVDLSWTEPVCYELNDIGGNGMGVNLRIAADVEFFYNGKIYKGDGKATFKKNQLSDKTVLFCAIKGVALDGGVATIDGDAIEQLVIPPNFSATSVVLKRTFDANVSSTIVLPFSFTVGTVDATFYTFNGVKQDSTSEDTSKYVATWKGVEAGTVMDADTPLGFKSSVATSSITFENVTISPTFTCSESVCTSKSVVTESVGNWDFNGTYNFRYFSETGEVGKAYGYASKAKTVDESEIAAGQFVKAGENAKIRPMRAYLIYKPKQLGRPCLDGALCAPEAASSVELPSSIDVRFIEPKFRLIDPSGLPSKNKDSASVVSDEFDTTLFDDGFLKIQKKRVMFAPRKSSDAWFDMKGRRHNGKPTAKGTYYNNGKRVIIK